MSVVNYHFYRWKSGNFQELLSWLQIFRKHYRKAVKQRIQTAIKRSAVKPIDVEEIKRLFEEARRYSEATFLAPYSQKEIAQKTLLDALCKVDATQLQQIKSLKVLIDIFLDATRQGLRSGFNVGSDVAILFHGGHIYTKFFVDDSLFEEVSGGEVFDLFFENLEYDGRSDRPEGITEEECEKRYNLALALSDGEMAWRDQLTFIIVDESDVFGMVMNYDKD